MKNNKINKRKIIGSIFLIAAAGFFILKMFYPGYVASDGFLYEPMFYLIPFGYISAFIGSVLLLFPFKRKRI